jgi:glycosyltransferase involved in cell wall biosynthesis
MKVALIHNQFSKSGGMESYLLTLVQGFLDAGDEVHVHAYEIDRELAKSYACTFHKTTLFFLPRRLRKYAFLNKYNRRFLRAEYDLSLSLTRTGCQDVAVVGGVHPQSVLTRRSQNWYRRGHDSIENRFERYMFTNVPWVVAHSKSIQAEIERHYQVAQDKVRVVYPPVNEKRFFRVSAEQCEQVRKKYHITSHKLTLLFPSMSHQRKGLHELLAAYAVLDPELHELIIVGSEELKKNRLSDNVRYIGYENDMASLYSAVDYVVLPSHYEPFGLVVTESLESGTPVMVTASVGAAELLGEESGVVIPDNHPQTLIDTIKGLRPKTIAPDFAARHGLKTGQHIDTLKQFARSSG